MFRFINSFSGKMISVFLAVFVPVSVMAQDIIIMRDGTDVEAVVREIGDEVIKYKRWTNQQGPDFSVATSRVASIRFQNGEIKRFAAPAPTQQPMHQQQFVQQPMQQQQFTQQPMSYDDHFRQQVAAQQRYVAEIRQCPTHKRGMRQLRLALIGGWFVWPLWFALIPARANIEKAQQGQCQR